MALLIAHHLEEIWDERTIPENQTDAKTQAHKIVELIKLERPDITQVVVTMASRERDEPVAMLEHANHRPKSQVCHELLIEYCEQNNIELRFTFFDAGIDHSIEWAEYLRLHLAVYVASNQLVDRLTIEQFTKLIEEAVLEKTPMSTLSVEQVRAIDPVTQSLLSKYERPPCLFHHKDEDLVWTSVPFGSYGEYNQTAIYPWMHCIDHQKEILICGAFDGECLLDLEMALLALNLKYSRLEQLILKDPEVH